MSETTVATPTTASPKRSRLGRGAMIVWAAVILLLAVLGWGLVSANAERPSDVAPDFEVSFFEGYEWNNRPSARLSDFKGQVVVLNFWASWCVECLLEAEALENTWRAYRDKGVVFLGVAYVDVEPKSLEYLQRFGITYPTAPDLRSLISEEYEITGVPETFFINQEGKVVHIQIGPVDEPLLTGLLDQMLADG
ncbi:MAG: TlpA family protein disulfide reductase [Chloroflexi bacterium]|nr:TlpA family protein disulfide reductase [Chloroflexota bacterium]MCI0578359.1 TlpA family protein disulfide reductase [Chloroflexota bacterium]MCI0646238.1 TlpA family protein disulfide reductase [Chloroflexota bacterium]MCI0732142.1 TlpA family protein disulfide reductase [Chloroflexota bacterium]